MGNDYETNHIMGARFSLKGNNISRIITQNYTPSKSIFESCQSFLKESTASAATERPKYGCYDYDDDNNQKNEYNYAYNQLQKHDDYNEFHSQSGDCDFDGFNSEGEEQDINGVDFAEVRKNIGNSNAHHENDDVQFEVFHTPDNYGNECDAMMGTSQFYQPFREVVDNNCLNGKEEEEEMTTRFKTYKNPQVHNSIDSAIIEEENKKQIQTTEKKLSRRNSDVVNIPINYDEFLKKTERSRLRSEGTDTTLNSERCNYYNEQVNKKMVPEIAQKTDGDEVRYHTSRLETSEVPKLENVLLKHSRGVFGNTAIIGETSEEEQQIQEQQPAFMYNPPLLYNTLQAGNISQEKLHQYVATQFSTQKKSGHFSNSIHENGGMEGHNKQQLDQLDKKYKNSNNSRNSSTMIHKSPSLSSLISSQKHLQQQEQSSPSSLKGQDRKQSQLLASAFAGESKIERHLQNLEKRLFQMESMNDDLTAEKNKVKEEFQSLLSDLQQAKQNNNLASTAGAELKNGEKEGALKNEIKFLIGKLLKVKTNLEKQSEEMMMINSSGVQTKKPHHSHNMPPPHRRASVQSEQDKYTSELHNVQSNPLYMTCSSSPPISGTYSSNSTIKKNTKNFSSNNNSLLSDAINSGSNSTANYNSNNSIKNTKSLEKIHQKQQIIHENLLEKMKITKSSLGQAIENFSKNVRCRSNLRDNWNRENINNNSSFSTKTSNRYGRPQDETTARAKTPVLARTDDGREVLLDFRKMKKNV